MLTPAALPLTVDTWVLADLMKKMRRTEAPAGSRRGRAAAKALWQRAHRNPNSGHPVLYGDVENAKTRDTVRTPLDFTTTWQASRRGIQRQKTEKRLTKNTVFFRFSNRSWSDVASVAEYVLCCWNKKKKVRQNCEALSEELSCCCFIYKSCFSGKFKHSSALFSHHPQSSAKRI